MEQTIFSLCQWIVFTPLIGAVIAGLLGKQIGRRGAHTITIIGIAISFILSLIVCKAIVIDGVPSVNQNLFTWATSVIPGGASFTLHAGFLIDPLTSVMMVTVTFVSLFVHIYSIGYMADDSGYQRFFSYMSLFTFMMLMLVSSNNFLQLFFGWEGVGLVSYLLIGFWFTRESAVIGSLKAFIVNRVGDVGFILGIAMVLTYFDTLDYQTVFNNVPMVVSQQVTLWGESSWQVLTLLCIFLFIGAMGKSAQVPLHVWLPESMEGPTPISALIHAATMVTAGIFMVARMSPLFEQSEVARSLVLVVGATGALFLGLLAIVQNDIKRVVAYSTLSQLGYMATALGASAYAAGIFHLMTHAAFKALLFLGAGSVIIAMHHEQDIRKMGGLRKYMPITYITFLLGSLSIAAIPPFAGFFSKDAIIESVRDTTIPGASYAYFCILMGAFVTALYSFRVFFLVFHMQERMNHYSHEHIDSKAKSLHESPWTVWLPLVVLAVPSVVLGAWLVEPMLYADKPLLGSAIQVLSQHDVLAAIGEEFQGVLPAVFHAVYTLPFWFALGGIVTAWICYIVAPALPQWIESRFQWIYDILLNKYGFDDFNQFVIVRGGRALGEFFFSFGDRTLIDGVCVHGLANRVKAMAGKVRVMQTGYMYHYAFAMVVGVIILFVMYLWKV